MRDSHSDYHPPGLGTVAEPFRLGLHRLSGVDAGMAYDFRCTVDFIE
jgi:hypothetical protein